MLRITKEKEIQNPPSLNAARYIEGFSLSTDTKPTDRISTGSNIIEVDTGDVYFYDEVSESWSAMLSLKA